MTRYEYQTSFVELPSDKKWYETIAKTNPHELIASGTFREHLNEMGAQGWRIAQVEPLVMPGSGGMATETKGYFIFWERVLR